MGNHSSRRLSACSEDSAAQQPGNVGQAAVAVIPRRLYVGSRLDGMAAKVKNSRKFTHLLCLEQSGKYPDDGDALQYLHESLDDDGGDDLDEFCRKVEAFMVEGVKKGKLLVHCTSGVNRAPAVSIWFLMKHRGMSFAAAKALVAAKRHGVALHENYEMQLRKLDSEWRNSVAAAAGKRKSIRAQPQAAQSVR